MRMENKVIDLHMHSVNSDGTFTTQQMIDMLYKKGANIISFTDHDSVGCYYDLKNRRAQLYPGVMLISGVELSCQFNGCLRDMLGYGISIPFVNGYLNEKYSLEHRIEKQQYILEQLKSICKSYGLLFDPSISVREGKKAEGFVIMYNELNRYQENVCRYPFIANNTQFYWNYFSNRDSEFFVDETYDLPTFSEAVDIIHQAGGKAFLAHPYAYGLEQNGVAQLVQTAVCAGIDGIELKHSSNKGSDVNNILDFAKRYHLLLSGGTDFHGATKPGLELVTGYGNMLVQYEEIEPWIKNVRNMEVESNENIFELWS